MLSNHTIINNLSDPPPQGEAEGGNFEISNENPHFLLKICILREKLSNFDLHTAILCFI